MIHRPRFITFTGVDQYTPIAAMQELAALYPIEWGILFSAERQGRDPRYPPLEFVAKLLAQHPSRRYAAHLCGDHARQVAQGGDCSLEGLPWAFARAQINMSDVIDVELVSSWACKRAVAPILQCRGDFPCDTRVTWLFDASGGRGISPSAWPAPNPSLNVLNGYAGGLNPENVAQAVRSIGAMCAGNYYLDMESGVRDQHDRFSVDRCRQVCEAVYGMPDSLYAVPQSGPAAGAGAAA